MYRGIVPVLSFQSKNHPLNLPQYAWYSRTEGIAAARVAGKEMMVSINDDGRTYQLFYLDMAHPTSFESMDDAKAAAPDFARAVLLHMLSVVGAREDDRSLLVCLRDGGQ